MWVQTERSDSPVSAASVAPAFAGKVGTGFPSANAQTKQRIGPLAQIVHVATDGQQDMAGGGRQVGFQDAVAPGPGTQIAIGIVRAHLVYFHTFRGDKPGKNRVLFAHATCGFQCIGDAYGE